MTVHMSDCGYPLPTMDLKSCLVTSRENPICSFSTTGIRFIPHLLLNCAGGVYSFVQLGATVLISSSRMQNEEAGFCQNLCELPGTTQPELRAEETWGKLHQRKVWAKGLSSGFSPRAASLACSGISIRSAGG
jgi:hypothetical protein